MDLIPPEDVPRLQSSKENLLRGRAHIGEWRLKRADGSYAEVEVNARILADGQWVGLVRDISERKQHAVEREALLAQTECDRQRLQTILIPAAGVAGTARAAISPSTRPPSASSA